MLLAELTIKLLPAFPPSVQKDMQTSVRYLAHALQCAHPKDCPLELYNKPLPTLFKLLEDHLTSVPRSKPITLHTIRNTKNNISRLFRVAAQQSLLTVPTPLSTPHYDAKHKVPRPGGVFSQNQGTYLPYAQWPVDLQSDFQAFQIWATAPLILQRSADLRKRVSTTETYKVAFEGYFGYLYHAADLIPTFDRLFDLSLVTNYIHWHINERHHRPTLTIRKFVTCLLALSRQYRPLPEFRTQLHALSKTIPVPSPTYNKRDAWVPLAALEEIGRSLWPRLQPHQIPQLKQRKYSPGQGFATRAALSLMFRLWTYIPYRQRNMREMQLGDNLYKDADGHWRIRFHGEQLKIATKRGRPNIFDLPFPDTLVPVLEDYLAIWRPILLAPASQPSNHLFLTKFGTPYPQRTLTRVTQYNVYRFTGKHWHPHIIRTIWATEWIQKTHGDFYTAAIMLNDRLETVIAQYTHLLEEDVAEKAYRLIEERNDQGK